MTSLASLTDKREQRFQNLLLLTIILVYLLILAGGIVRATGSGMGCPDWPKCFGRWIPPTEFSQLPPNYQEIYGAKLKGEVEFNAVKTWIEYANRLLGVLVGFSVFGTLLASLTYWKSKKAVVLGSLVSFFLVGANGWLGSRVVATELAQYMITAHLLLAVLVVFALLFVLVRSRKGYLPIKGQYSVGNGVRWLLIIAISLTLTQILLGTQVRTALDAVIRGVGYTQRETWISQLGLEFYIHRSFSLAILVINLILFYQLRKIGKVDWFRWIPSVLIAFIMLEIMTGVLMAYLSVPALLQPIHLLLSIAVVGLQFVALLLKEVRANVRRVPEQSRLVKI
ncbi:COX15/CtaA family protein [Spirosoma luteum]|uniref:COX15/CtaA family protein n=1 Tax=Spirosoma luteum TaxID=431553 RepID=UPI00036F8479|nr:COX15/CtaA family protein [Spirosoma luteum]